VREDTIASENTHIVASSQQNQEVANTWSC